MNSKQAIKKVARRKYNACIARSVKKSLIQTIEKDFGKKPIEGFSAFDRNTQKHTNLC